MRDVAAARGVADGRYPEDPAYVGEVLWYNPLVPALVALLAKTSGVSIEVLYAQAGTYLNLLTPIAFYILARGVVGGWSAVAALAAYLFLADPTRGSMFQATYSPWLYPYNFVQALTFITLHMWARVFEHGRLRSFLGLGFLLGAVFLGHTAPAILISLAVVTAHAVVVLRDRSAWPRELGRVLLVGCTALTVSAIFLLPIFLRYRFRIANADPGSLSIVGGRVLLDEFVSVRGIITIAGAWFFARQLNHGRRNDALPFCGALAASLLLFGYGVLAPRFALPSIVPSFHFHMYLTAFGAVLFGRGLVDGAVALARFTPARITAPRLAAIAVVPLLAYQLLRYPNSLDLRGMRASSLWVQQNSVATALYAWFSKQPREGSVLTSLDSSLWIAAAGHPVMVAFPTYSNPYVSFAQRDHVARELWRAWRGTDVTRTLALARKHHVRYVLVEDTASRVPVAREIVPVFQASAQTSTRQAPPLAQSALFFAPVPFLSSARVFRIE